MSRTFSASEVLSRPADRAHLMQFYADPSELASNVSLYFSEGFRRGESAVAVSTPAHWEEFRAGLDARGHDPEELRRDGRLVVLDARETLSSFLRDGVPDETLFRKALGPVLSKLSARGSNVRAFGEMVSLLWQDRRYDAAVRLEELWNELHDSHRFTLLCAYEGSALAPEFHGRCAEQVYAAHSHVLPPNHERLNEAVDRALDEVLGADAAGALRPLIAANRRPIAAMAGAQASLLWLQSNLPDRVDAVLAAARKHFAAAAVR